MPAGTLVVNEIVNAYLALVARRGSGTPVTVWVTPTGTFGDTFDNVNGDVVIAVKNASGGDITVQVTPSRTFHGVLPSPSSLTVGAGTEGRFGPFPQSVFNTVLGIANVLCSATTSITIAAFRLVQP